MGDDAIPVRDVFTFLRYRCEIPKFPKEILPYFSKDQQEEQLDHAEFTDLLAAGKLQTLIDEVIPGRYRIVVENDEWMKDPDAAVRFQAYRYLDKLKKFHMYLFLFHNRLMNDVVQPDYDTDQDIQERLSPDECYSDPA